MLAENNSAYNIDRQRVYIVSIIISEKSNSQSFPRSLPRMIVRSSCMPNSMGTMSELGCGILGIERHQPGRDKNRNYGL